MAQKRNCAIVCCRTASMVLIVLCHIIGHYSFIPGHNFLGDIMDVGVFSFLAISGYLYGGKSITDFKSWFRKRYLAVMFPATILILAVLLAGFCVGHRYNAITVVTYLLNLQGLEFFVPGFHNYFAAITVLGPLWFITVIMLCYCMIPVLQKYREKMLAWKYSTLAMICAVPVGYGLMMLTGFNPMYFLTFAIGYFLAAKGTFAPVRMRWFLTFSAVMLFAQIFRLILRALCDGTSVYQNYTQVSHLVLGVWILYFFFAFEQMFPKITQALAEHKLVVAGNDISFYVYLVHYSFCKGALNFYELIDNLLLSTAAFAVATIISALILKKITVFLQAKLTAHL